jgi:Oxidoreductase family, NAD-binding Rossmann fold.
METIRIGMIGLDTSHASAFTKLLNNPETPFHVSGARVVKAFPAGSADYERSFTRIQKITQEVQSYGVEIVSSLEEAVQDVDAVLLESVDGRVHLEQFRKIVSYRKPVFVDKPFATSVRDAGEIIGLSKESGTPVMSCSSLRFAENLQNALSKKRGGSIIGAECFGPMEIEETQPGYFWYGIHLIEMLYAVMGRGAKDVKTFSGIGDELLVSEWEDGRFGVIRGNKRGNFHYGCVLHFETGDEFIAVDASEKPFYASLLEQVLAFFRDGKSRVDPDETLEIIRFIEAANKSMASGRLIPLDGK